MDNQAQTSKAPEQEANANQAATPAEAPKAPAAAPEVQKANGVATPVAPQAPAVQQPVATPAERIPTRKLIGGDDDDIPDNADLIEMSPKSLKSRLERSNKKQLRDRFGTDDMESIKAKLDKFAEYEAKQEEQRLAQLSEGERMKEELNVEKTARLAAETRVKELQESRILESEDRRVMNIAAKYLDPDYIDTNIPVLARHLDGLSEEDLKNPEKAIEDFFKDLVTKKPKLAKEYEAEKKAVEEQKSAAPVKMPLNNGPNVAKPPNTASSGNAGTKNVKEMSASEYRQYKQQVLGGR